ncbi:calpain-10 [Trichechus manatus latirostris]|uniref:Calpain-10 n=1 Tax=Trichechus manatus latirostris TaxID=127582 RepID=A0A2Y9RY55_TRIMA|nr:calpain-10 [Trichechus manatus latirostris]
MGARGAEDAGGWAETPAPELFRDAAFPASNASLFFNFSTPLAQFQEDFTWRRPQVGRVGAGSRCQARVRVVVRMLLCSDPQRLGTSQGACAARLGERQQVETVRPAQSGVIWGPSCSDPSDPHTGAQELGEFHAFIISDLRELDSRAGQGVLLLRIHNPWGRPCWRGRWREGGEGWSLVEAAEATALLSQLQEGEFWVDEEEFLLEFDELTIGFPVSEDGHLQSLHSGKALPHTQVLSGAWVRGQSAGGCRNNSSFPSNPKFWVRVWEPSEVCLAVLQRPRASTADRAGRAGDNHATQGPASLPGRDLQAVGLHVWKVEKRRVSLPRVLSAPPAAGTPCHAYDREVHLCCELSPGYYLAVPSTFLKDVSGQFLLRAFSSGRVSLSAIKLASRSPAPGGALPAGEWETVLLQGCWQTGQTAGGSRNFASYPSNPCLPFSVPTGGGTRCVRITLRQHCQDGACHPIGFHVFQVPGGGGSQDEPSPLCQEPLSSCVPHRHALEVSQLCRLPAGTYGVVPSTYLPNTEAAFTVTIATRIDRRSLQSRERLGQLLQEASFTALMKT